MTKNNADTPVTPGEAVETAMPDSSPGFILAEAACWHLLTKNAGDVSVLDLRGFSDVCDFFVIAAGNSDVQVKALARDLRDVLSEQGHRPRNVEGLDRGRWVLLDFFDVVVHVFQEKTRNYYQLERLWDDAERLDISPDWFRDPAVAARHPELNFTFAPGAETQGS